jgi:hypothetical protein
MNMELHIRPSRLERHARLLLRAYPPAYRADRGEEMLGTLLEATPDGQNWPSARDARSLLAGGLRARAARNARLALAVSLRQAALLGLSLYVVQQVSWGLFTLSISPPIPGATATTLVSSGLLMAAVTAAWLGRRLLTAVAAVPVCAALAYHAALSNGYYHPVNHAAATLFRVQAGVPSITEGLYLSQAPLMLSVVALAVLARRDTRPPLTWLWLPALLLADMAACWLGGVDYPFVQVDISVAGPLAPLDSGPSLLFVIPILIWLVTDARPALGLAAFLVMVELSPTIGGIEAFLTAGSPSQLREARIVNAVILVLMLALAAGLAQLLRRRTRQRGEAAS